MMPLYGFLEGDTIGLLILAEEQDTVEELGRKLQAAASVRVVERSRVRVIYQEHDLDPHITVQAAGIQALDRFDVVSFPGAAKGEGG